ncbi:MAG: HTTM domain-containing protein [Flavobacteriales bacterium]|nr:HTTM domain-containing protein [Flavobacteriales bacterium]
MNLSQKLFKPVESYPVAIWRILFGLVLVFETIGSNLVGWTKTVFIEPKFTFTFIGFEWLQPLSGNGMYWLFSLLGLLAVFITIGFYYRFSMVMFTVGWAAIYFMHKTSYNNHHYLMLLLCVMMIFTPANTVLSFDAKSGRIPKSEFIPALFKWQYMLLLGIVYTYASIAKWYPDWINDEVFYFSKNHPVFGWFFVWPHSGKAIAWGGILFDLLIIPVLLFSRTRVPAFLISIVFHLFNSVTFQIGTFPYMMIASSVFFFSESRVRRFFRIKAIPTEPPEMAFSVGYKKVATAVFVLFFCFQLLLPLRHHFIKGYVTWTEEGHKLSWRMMLRSKTGTIHFKIMKNGKEISHTPSEHLTGQQLATMKVHPCMIWQYCQFLKKLYGEEIEIYIISFVKLNQHERQQFIDPTVDMAKAEWHFFKHEDWILPFDRTK